MTGFLQEVRRDEIRRLRNKLSKRQFFGMANCGDAPT
jgi:hypothetical protein